MAMSNLPTARIEVCMACRPANHRTEHGSFEKLNVGKTGHIVLDKNHNICCRETLCALTFG